MLTGMVTALAHAARSQPFSSNFYIVVATVIPVLFLAIAVQGDYYAALLKIFTEHDPGESRVSRGIGGGFAVIISAIILVGGIYGEIAALYALSHATRLPETSGLFDWTAGLVIITGIGPVTRFFQLLAGNITGTSAGPAEDSAAPPGQDTQGITPPSDPLPAEPHEG